MSTDTILTQAQRHDLRTISRLMVPPSAEYNVPGADDIEVQNEILSTLGRDAGPVREALDHIARLAGAPLDSLAADRRDAVVQEFRTTGGAAAAALSRVVLQCYYRDARVLRSLNLELRPPFPKGYALEDGDWSLLEPVKARPPSWRKAP